MLDRPNKPSALVAPEALPPTSNVNITHDNSRVSALLPTGVGIEILLHGATIISWKDVEGNELLWLSESAQLDGSAPVRGGIPIVFPVFGTSPDHEATSKLPQHGFARNSRWEFLGRSTGEGSSSSSYSVKLDFGLSSENLADDVKALWPYKFGLIYSVSLDHNSLTTSLVVTNEGDESFEFQALLHNYFRVDDVGSIKVSGLEDSEYIDKLDNLATVTQSGAVTFSGETDRVYTPAQGPKNPVVISEGGTSTFSIVRDNLDQVVVWNPWVDKAASIKDFSPDNGWKNMVCVEPGSVKGWQKLDKGDAFEASQAISLE